MTTISQNYTFLLIAVSDIIQTFVMKVFSFDHNVFVAVSNSSYAPLSKWSVVDDNYNVALVIGVFHCKAEKFAWHVKN